MFTPNGSTEEVVSLHISKDSFLSRIEPSIRDADMRVMKVSSASRIAGIPSFLAAMILLLIATFVPSALCAQVETSLPTSQRVTINLSAGMPGQGQWLYAKDQDSQSFTSPSFDDSTWTPVGVPHGANYLTSFLNVQSGGGDGDLNGAQNWYRLHFTLGTQYSTSKVLVEFEGAHTGAQVYINGTLLPGISAVTANAEASHVVGFIPFVVDLTPYLHTDGVTDNVLAVSVSRSNSWFEEPGFSQAYRFGQAEAGLFRPAYMFITNQVHIPVNVYSNQKTWGTYVATVSEVPSPTSTAQATSAVVEVQTNVLNESAASQQVTLTTQIVDASGNVVAAAPPVTQTVAPMTAGTFPSTAAPMFDQQITVNNPTLWYPNNSTFGTPYMYRVYHIVSVNGVVVDSAQSPLGIRTITWDTNFPYFNGHPMYLWGASGRYDYPGLGSSVPEEQQWRDLAQLAAAGGNLWRPGHSTASEEFVAAADAYGIMIAQPSGDGEGAFSSPSADAVTLKEELHRDMIIRDRSHPSILSWESNNGTMQESIGKALLAINQTWDPINTRVAADRTPDPVNGYMLGCTLEGCEVGIKNSYPNNPAWGSEYWGNGTGRGLAWDYQLAFAAPYLDNWRKGREANAFGMSQWYFADSPGEDGLFAEYQQYLNTPAATTYTNSVRSLGASMVDMNRFPKLLYYVYEAAWTPFSLKPVVHLAHHWNRAYQDSAPIQENVFSNCPSVRLLINGVQQGSTQTPNGWNSDSSANLTQSTTLMPFQASWSVNWVAGTVEADCLDQYGSVVAKDTKTTAGTENKIVLSVVPELTKPDGSSFAVTANGSDAAFIVAQVQDANGNVVPTASDIVTFSVNGPATYLGGTEQYVSTGTDAYSTSAGNSEFNYHAPGDPQLQFEGGLTKIAVLSQFTPGTVTVTASAPGLISGTASYSIQPVPSILPAPSAPAIIVPPVSTAVTVGQTATFSVSATGTAPFTFQWLKNGAAIAGANSAAYTTPATTSADDNTNFAVTVTNSVGSTTSSAVNLSVDTPAAVSITAQPVSQTAYVGQSIQLSVVASGSPTLTYQWQLNGAAISGATNSSYTTPVLTSADNGDSFTVLISNPVNKVVSSAAALTVLPAVAPTITQQPTSLSVLANNPATFTVAASGSSPFSYQWQFNGVNLPGTNSPSYSILEVQASNAGTYSVIVTNAAGSVSSVGATLSIAPPGVNLALNQPATASSIQGSGFTANLVNDGDLTTRWASAAGIDPSWIAIDLGSVVTFDNVILSWQAAFATVYQIQYSTDNINWSVAYTNNSGAGGVENLTFPSVQGRYVRMYGETRATGYGYSLFEFQVYNVPQCGGPGERYSVLSPSLVLDNMSQITWQRAETTYAGTGAQYTQSIAQNACVSQGMRLPTLAEGLAISGPAAASCAFPQGWNTWTSTVDPDNSNNAGFVSSTGVSSYQVANNYPGAVICASGTTVPPPTITTQPVSASANLGASATFAVVGAGTGPLTYQWYKNGKPITAAINSIYTTPSTTSTDNGATFYVVVIGPTNETVTSSTVALTVLPPPPDVIAIAAGGQGAGSFSADEYFSGGGTAGTSNSVSLSGVVFPAPESVYQSERSGAISYTIPGLAPGNSYPVRLHFAEFYFTSAGQRVFNVAINGTTVLSNFDIIAAAGGPNQAVVEQFNAIANNDGEIVIALIAGAANQPKIDGIEVQQSNGTCTSVPSAPTALVPIATSASTVSLTWTAAVAPTGCSVSSYSVYRSTTSGFTPSAASLVASALTTTTYNDTGLNPSTTYYYAVEAVDGAGFSPASNQANVATLVGQAQVLAINSGGAALSGTSWAADEDSTGGGTYSNFNTVSTTGVVNAAPMAIYQSERSGVFNYVLPGLTAGNSYTVRLHFAEIYWTQTGQRVFNVAINGTPVLSNFDIVNIAGGPNIAIVKQFTATANSGGQIVISFTAGTADQPKISGVELLAQSTTTSAAGNFPLTIVNGTGGQWSDSSIWLTIIGQVKSGVYSYVTPDGATHTLNSAPASGAGSIAGPNGVTYAPFSFQVFNDQTPGVTMMPANLQGGRVYISIGAPLYLASSPDSSGYATPDPANPSDPNFNTYWDFYEFAYVYGTANAVNYGGDTTQVDQFSFPINAEVQQQSTGFDQSSQILTSRSALFNLFLNNSNPDYAALANTYRVLSPRTSSVFGASATSAAMQTYINSTWDYYTANPFTFTEPGQVFAGGVQSDGMLHFSYQGTGDYVLAKPVAQDVWQCSGALSPPNTSGVPTTTTQVEGALGAQFCAAFNRGVAQNTASWWTPSQYYLNSTANQYSGYFHGAALNGLAYGFPYDDVNSQSSVIILPNNAPPSNVILTVKW